MDYKKASDQDLWRLCQKQDDIKAYAELFDRYVILLRRQAVRYIKNDFDAEEIVMDLLFNLWAKRARLNPDGDSLKKYFYRALHNRIINHLKKKLPVIVSMDTVTEDSISGFLSSDHRIIEQEISAAFSTRLAQLSPQRQQVFMMCREENLSYRSVANRLGLSVNTVENHMASALNFLRKHTQDLTTLSLLLIPFL